MSQAQTHPYVDIRSVGYFSLLSDGTTANGNEWAVARQDRKSTHLGFTFPGFLWVPVVKWNGPLWSRTGVRVFIMGESGPV